MRKIIVALLAATTLGVGAAAAADLPRRAPAPMYSPAPVFSWNGFYIGANAGWGWANTDSGASDMNGFVGGGQIGYNWQGASPLVLGIEADFQGTAQKRTDTMGAFSVEQQLPWFGTVRGRIGYAFDRVMLYGTGGLAYGNYKLSVSGPGGTISDDATKAGWTLGGGVEWMFAPQWSTKLEYLYIDTGDQNVTLFGTTFTGRARDNIVRVGLNYHF
jgi:outer membrane immunogenic protein